MNYLIITISLLLIIILGITNLNNIYYPQNNYIDYIMYFISGLTEAIGTVIPGLSSTALLMIIGIYNTFINSLSNISNPDSIIFLIYFSLGLFIGIILISYLIDYLLTKYKEKTYAIIIGISLSSIILMLIKCFNISFNIIELIIGLILFILGIIISYFLN